MPGDERQQIARLQAENERLKSLLRQHGIAWAHEQPGPAPESSARLNPDEKVQLFASLFRGREDVYPIRWESKAGKSGYAPACANEWRAGICEKPRVKCGDCQHRALIPLTGQTLFDHLAGRHTIGVYPLLNDDTCHFLAVDFDDAEWREDVRGFAGTCDALGVPVALEVSRSGNGAHAWIFFSPRVAARDARRLGTALISHTCARTRQLKLGSYDRLFPNQDTMPKGGFGNLIALPLQKVPRERGGSVFVDHELQPHDDQWAFLASLPKMSPADIEATILRATGGCHPLDVTFIDSEDQATPWRRQEPASSRLPGPMPASLKITLANLIYFEKAALPQPLSNRLIRLAAFQNPEFYKAQAMRLPVWDEPRVIGCAENYPLHIALPRGCLEPALTLLRDNGIRPDVHDERSTGTALPVQFRGALRPDQQQAVDTILTHDIGVLCAPTAFGKTVTAAALIAARGVNTLILVHRAELLRQWRERLQTFLAEVHGDGLDRPAIGTIGGGKSKPTGRIDIALMQSLCRQGDVNALVEDYGHIVVDECHHLSAFSFEAILKRAKAKYVLGLTATPVRRDGRQPIIFMQCGPTRHTAEKPSGSPQTLEIVPRYLASRVAACDDAPIQQVFRVIAADASRTAQVAGEVTSAFVAGGKVLALTERTEHLDALREALDSRVSRLFVLHGRMSAKQRTALLQELEALPADAPRVLVSTGKLVGEGFDHAPLDTLVLAMPISWKGTLAQYAGRLHREHAGKESVRIVDFVDEGHPALLRMWERRQRGYRAMGYRFVPHASDLFDPDA